MLGTHSGYAICDLRANLGRAPQLIGQEAGKLFYAALIYELRIPPNVVQGIIGHSSINLTMTVYAHSTEAQESESQRN